MAKGRLALLGAVAALACSPPPSTLSTGVAGHGGAPDGGALDGGLPDGSPPDVPRVAGLAVPRLIAPLSTATVTSRRPTLRWVLAEGIDSAHVQICADRACTKEVTSFDANDSGRPADALPKGVLFWRAFGRSGGAIGQTASPTWEFTVGARSAPVDTSWGTTPDVNGDGYADVLVTAPYAAGSVFVYLGGPSGLDSSPQTVLSDGPGVVASAGDVNGDGYADVIASAEGSAAYLYLGGASGLSSSPAVTLPSPKTGGDFGVRVQSAGDVNGDGYADVVVGDNAWGQAYVYYGSPDGLSSSPAVTLSGPAGGGLGHSVDGAGDVNGDGYADVIVSVPDVNSNNGQVYLYLGSATGLATSPAVTIDCPAGSDGGCRMAGAGDVNGDGYADMIVGLNYLNGSVGQAYVYLGGAAGLASSPAVTLVGPETNVGDAFGRWVAPAGDLNGDGYADVVVGADAEGDQSVGADGGLTQPAGWVHVYLGSATGPASSPTVTLTGPDGVGSWFGRCVNGAGDVNGDGYGDLIVGAEAYYSGGPGWAHLYLGNSAGVASSPAATLTGPSAGSHFGVSVASVTAPELESQR
jgi:hypothetical protein